MRWFAGSAQVFWALAAILAGLAVYLASNTELIDAAFDRHADAYDVDETYHPPTGGGKGDTKVGSYEISYAFRDDAGVEHRGTSYGRHRPDAIDVEYVAGDPSTSRIVGMSSGSIPAFVTILIMATALAFAGVSFPWAARYGPASFDPERARFHLTVLPVATVVLVGIALVELLTPR